MPLSYNTNFWETYGIQKPSLTCLVNDAELFDCKIYQPQFRLDYDSDFLKISDEELESGIRKFRNFFELSVNNTDISICPEYSCPWDSLQQCLEDNIIPALHAIWVAGCASIKARELQERIDILSEINQDFIFIYEKDKVAQNLENERFFDPVCLIFRTRTIDTDLEKIVVIIQFKTESFGGRASVWEMEGLIKGEIIYIIENALPSVKLITLICSDSLQNLNFEQSLPDYQHAPYFIVHIQLNTDPFHANYNRHKRESFQQGRNLKDFLCVNWARNVHLKNEDDPWNLYGGSAFYTNLTYPWNLEDQRINSNQRMGLYYNYWPDFKIQLYFFNYDEAIFHFQNTKASRESASVEQRVRAGGLIARENYHWDANTNTWLAGNYPEDGFASLCGGIEEEYGNIDAIKNNTDRLNVERLLMVSTGNISSKSWYYPQNLFSFQILSNEANSRITFTQDPDQASLTQRRNILMNYSILKNQILTQPALPDEINDLAGQVNLIYDITKSKFFNIYPVQEANNVAPALGMFIGINSKGPASVLYNAISKLLSDVNIQHRFVLWYLTGAGVYEHISISKKSGIKDNPNKRSNAINSTAKNA
jgi:hypothetical protein